MRIPPIRLVTPTLANLTSHSDFCLFVFWMFSKTHSKSTQSDKDHAPGAHASFTTATWKCERVLTNNTTIRYKNNQLQTQLSKGNWTNSDHPPACIIEKHLSRCVHENSITLAYIKHNSDAASWNVFLTVFNMQVINLCISETTKNGMCSWAVVFTVADRHDHQHEAGAVQWSQFNIEYEWGQISFPSAFGGSRCRSQQLRVWMAVCVLSNVKLPH